MAWDLASFSFPFGKINELFFFFEAILYSSSTDQTWLKFMCLYRYLSNFIFKLICAYFSFSIIFPIKIKYQIENCLPSHGFQKLLPSLLSIYTSYSWGLFLPFEFWIENISLYSNHLHRVLFLYWFILISSSLLCTKKVRRNLRRGYLILGCDMIYKSCWLFLVGEHILLKVILLFFFFFVFIRAKLLSQWLFIGGPNVLIISQLFLLDSIVCEY